MWAVVASSARILSASMPLMRQVDVHQDDIRRAARQSRCALAVPCTQQADVGPAREDSLHQHQIGGVVLDTEQGVRLRVGLNRGCASAVGRLHRSQVPGRRRVEFDPEHAAHPDGALHPDLAPINSTNRLLTTSPMPVPSSTPPAWPSRLNGSKSWASFLRTSLRRYPEY